MIALNSHSSFRMNERTGKVGDKARHKANKAFLEGVPREKLHGKLRTWVDRKYFRHDRTYVYHVHGDMLYVFNKKLLITCIPVPHKIKKEAKKKERRHKRWF